jgi:2-oxoglutarate/2-oxoacid ferredoxin oxidoreductase subunit alpha
MADFGEGYRHHVTGLTHDVRGFPTERPDEIGPLMARLFRKISQKMAEIHDGEFFQTEDAEIVVIAYGCVARSARRAVKDLRAEGIRAGMLKLNTLWPFMRSAVETLLAPAGSVPPVRTLVVPEMNMGQISREVKRVNQGRARVVGLNKMDGTIITPNEIADGVKETR